MREVRDVPGPDGFDCRIVALEPCGEPGCKCEGGPTIWLHWISPENEDRWLHIGSSEVAIDVLVFADSGKTADRFLRLAIALGVTWEDASANFPGVGAKQLQWTREAPTVQDGAIFTMPLDRLRALAGHADEMVGRFVATLPNAEMQ